MKKVLLTLGLILTTHSAQAGNLTLTCTSADNTVVMTRDNLILIAPSDPQTRQVPVTLLRNEYGETPKLGETLSFIELQTDVRIASIKVLGASNPQVIAEEQDECPGGHTPGFSTVQYTIRALLQKNGSSPQPVQLTCVESAFWSGNCRY